MLTSDLLAIGLILTALFMVCLGVMVLAAPRRFFEITKHTPEDLPQIMAGRYFFMASVPAICVWLGDLELMTGAILLLGAVAYYDGIIYIMKAKPAWPHIAAGALASGLGVIGLYALAAQAEGFAQ